MEWKKCKQCGGDFIGAAPAKYCCPECRNKAAWIRYKEKGTAKKDSLSETCQKAKEAGLSYGQYVAQEYLKELKAEEIARARREERRNEKSGK